MEPLINPLLEVVVILFCDSIQWQPKETVPIPILLCYQEAPGEDSLPIVASLVKIAHVIDNGQHQAPDFVGHEQLLFLPDSPK